MVEKQTPSMADTAKVHFPCKKFISWLGSLMGSL